DAAILSTPTARLEPQAAHAGSRADAIEPRLDWRQCGLELEAEAAEHHHARREGGIGERELGTHQVLAAVELVAKEVKAAAELLASLLDALRITLSLRLAQLREKHRRRRDERVVAVVLEETDLGARLRILRHQPGKRVFVLQILVDDGRVVDHL